MPIPDDELRELADTQASSALAVCQFMTEDDTLAYVEHLAKAIAAFAVAYKAEGEIK